MQKHNKQNRPATGRFCFCVDSSSDEYRNGTSSRHLLDAPVLALDDRHVAAVERPTGRPGRGAHAGLVADTATGGDRGARPELGHPPLTRDELAATVPANDLPVSDGRGDVIPGLEEPLPLVRVLRHGAPSRYARAEPPLQCARVTNFFDGCGQDT
ncbi:MAG: hypothetical protein COU35_02645 [Candidatus Magasanikbacteria bacterium CG10_big_fil_rev_8_21_14_0_10_47_10]|uniref:Uncharacterized protein n=1 Tax=Candidatus Magasanikbacteria bacterium CG10_big_fil_rev_8_21_14_0_10_47_10 TaxID=1974652 RepID=A0A2H0TSE5_9BACT|nr:MAG: hypothetical protein COU35_02645 [Candidatus Magasanikbacteria bacterium CG10_big_fil_rev_8_21_14_0_10_47_10]